MLKIQTSRRMAAGGGLGLLAGLLIVALESDFKGQICDYNQTTKHEDCTIYSLFHFLLIQVGKILNDYGVAITALATVAIAGFTWTLWITSREQARLASKAIELARDEFTASQKPKLIVRELLLFPPTPSRSVIEIRYTVANNGSGLAEIVESHIELMLIKDAILRPLQPIEGANPVGSVTLEPGQHIFRETGSTIGDAAFKNEMNRQLYDTDDYTKLFFRGFIIYADKNKIRRRMAFCRGYYFKRMRFRIIEDPDYEYAD